MCPRLRRDLDRCPLPHFAQLSGCARTARRRPRGARTSFYVRRALGSETEFGSSWGAFAGELETVTTTASRRTIVRSDLAYGGRIAAVAWPTVPRGTRYEPPDSTPRERVAADGLLAAGPIDLLAADGARVAFVACDRIVLWTPSKRDVDPSLRDLSTCAFHDVTGHDFIYDVALAGDRLLYERNQGCMSVAVSVHLVVLPSHAESGIAGGGGNCASPFQPAVGRAAGAGDLLVFDEWWEERGSAEYPNFPTTSAFARRVELNGCPCPVLISTLGFLFTADVDAGRALVYGANETVVLDRDGNRLLSIPVSPLAAQLAGRDVVTLLAGEIRVYDAQTGVLMHAWALPNVASGPVCAWRYCVPKRLVLQDAARGIVAYTLDGQLHLLRLETGKDSVVGPGQLARFMDAGLVYANGARLRLVPFASLL